MTDASRWNFVRQQGFENAPGASCRRDFSALMFQPRLLGVLVAVGLLLRAWPLFLALAAVLWWNAAVPSRNPFDALYNRLVARRRGLPPVPPAPGPRRFAQAMAGTFLLGLGVALARGWTTAAWIFGGLLVVALLALIVGRFCLGSFLFHLAAGRARFALRTLPWKPGS